MKMSNIDYTILKELRMHRYARDMFDLLNELHRRDFIPEDHHLLEEFLRINDGVLGHD